MSDASIAGAPLKNSAILPTRVELARRIAPPSGMATAILSNSDTQILRRTKKTFNDDIHIKVVVAPPTRLIRSSIRTTSVVAALVGLSQVAAQEAPAWAVSMVVHMVTLVTMAMVTTSTPVQAQTRQHLVVVPPEEQKIERLADSDSPGGGADGSAADSWEIGDATIDGVAFHAANDPDAMSVPGEGEFGLPDGGGSEIATDISDLTNSQYVPPASEVFGGMPGPIGDTPTNPGVGGMTASVVRPISGAGPTEASEKAVTAALNWLQNHQTADGSWSFNHSLAPECRDQCRNAGSMGEARNAATALALLPFLGHGDTHRVSKRYKSTINRGLEYLLQRKQMTQQGVAWFEPGGRMYSQGLASIAVCEAYAMTHDPMLEDPARAAINFICYAQDPRGGGWRYMPREPGDTSMVGWQLMALKSGYMAKLPVPPETIRKATQYLDSVQIDDGALYGYTDASKGTGATTAIGLLSRMYLGWKGDNPSLRRGVQWLGKAGPSPNNFYYNYYATQVMRHWGGEEWKNWNQKMREQLVNSQSREGHEKGSWFIAGGDYGAATGGRLYCTAMSAMILEVYNRVMPIYGQGSVETEFPE